MKVQEVIDLINGKEIYCIWDAECMIDCKLVAECLNLDEHRWYSIATSVYKCEDGFVGITGAFQSFSEEQTWEDIGVVCGAREYKEIPSVSYIPK